jgi:hypothetical protein
MRIPFVIIKQIIFQMKCAIFKNSNLYENKTEITQFSISCKITFLFLVKDVS